ncbi:MAG: outer membrane lipoprotein carrier protein LolA [Elusimicrobia bacterium]|nr:outer membrane lipoprotein carrier protein LolA [Elusimicrobiota bacterium]
MNKILTAALLLALALGAAAQQKPAPKKTAQPVKKETAQPAKKPAAAPTAARPAAAADKKATDPAAEIMEGLKAWDAKLETLKADFTQEVNFTEAGLKQSIQGSLRYVKPNLLRIEHTRPASQLVVTDKTDIWIYKPADNQAVRTSWDAWRRTQDQNFSGILDFGNYSSLAARNAVLVTPSADGGPVTVVFTPRSGAGYTLTLKLSPQDYFPVGAELSVDGTIISTRLTAVEKNSSVDKEIFKFSPPKGVEVLEFKNQ